MIQLFARTSTTKSTSNSAPISIWTCGKH